MGLLTATELTGMRSCVEAEAFDQTASIESVTLTPDGQGGNSEAWAEASSVACLVLPKASPGDKTEGVKRQSDARWIIRMPHGTSVTARNRITVSGTTYQVLAVDAGKGNALTVDAECKSLT